MPSCFFIGHRTAPPELRPLIADAIERHITEHGVSEFLAGRYGGFDQLVTAALREAKQRHPSISLILLTPYHPADRPVSLPEGFDTTYYPRGLDRVPKSIAIRRANEIVIGEVEYLICYDLGLVGNTRELVKLARKRAAEGKMSVENIAEQIK